jgi:Domain of unknown function (DUF4394)
MNLSRSLRRGVVLVALLALAAPLAVAAGNGKGGNDRGNGRVFYATDAANTLLQFSSNKPRKLRAKHITGLPERVAIKGIDFRPASGDLYALGSNKVVYRLNPRTAIAVPEGPSFDRVPSILNGDNMGFDFNPTVDKIRVTSDAHDNLRLNPDDGTLLMVDTMLTPADVQVVGSAYTNSSFTAVRPTVTELYAYDVSGDMDRLWIQRPANAGTLIMPVSSGLRLRGTLGFDIAGINNVGWVAGQKMGRPGSRLLHDHRSRRGARPGRVGAMTTGAGLLRRGEVPRAQRDRGTRRRKSRAHRARGAAFQIVDRRGVAAACEC